MSITGQKALAGVYNTHSEAEAAVKELQRSGFDMKKLSIVGKDYHTEEHVVGYYNTGDRMKSWGKLGAFWGGLWGMLFGGLLFGPGYRSHCRSRSFGGLDSFHARRGGRGRRHDCNWRRTVQHRHPQRQYPQV